MVWKSIQQALGKFRLQSTWPSTLRDSWAAWLPQVIPLQLVLTSPHVKRTTTLASTRRFSMVLLWWWLTLGFESYTDSMKPPPFVRPQEKKHAGLCLFFIPWSAETWSKSGFCFLELSENPGFCLKNKGDTAMCSVWNVQPYARHAIAVWSTAAAVVVLVFIISSYSNLCLVTDCLNFKFTSVSHINRCVLRAEHDSILIRWIAGKSYSNSERDSSQWGRW